MRRGFIDQRMMLILAGVFTANASVLVFFGARYEEQLGQIMGVDRAWVVLGAVGATVVVVYLEMMLVGGVISWHNRRRTQRSR